MNLFGMVCKQDRHGAIDLFSKSVYYFDVILSIRRNEVCPPPAMPKTDQGSPLMVTFLQGHLII